MQGPQQNVAWSKSNHEVQKLQPVGLTEQVVVVVMMVELYSPVVQWVQMAVAEVEVQWNHAGCSSEPVLVGPGARLSSDPILR